MERNYHDTNRGICRERSLAIIGRNSEHGRVQAWFSQNAHALIDGSRLVKVEPIEGKRPDFLIEQGDCIYPVECKLSFSKKALKQLQGYMKLWKAKRGYAVATKLACTLPESIIFIQCP